jgi:hypothetical protein
LISNSLRCAIIGREQPVSQQIARCAGPGFVGIAAKVSAHGRNELSSMCIPHVNIHIENEGRDLLNHTGDGEISTKLLCVLHVAAATGLQVTGVRRAAALTGVMSRTTNLPAPASALRNCSATSFSRRCSSVCGPFTSPCRLVSRSSKSNTATLSGSACASDETNSISATTKPGLRMIVVREFTAAQHQCRLYKTVRPCFKPELLLSSISRREET